MSRPAVSAGSVIGPFNGLQAFAHEMPGIAAKPLPGWQGSTVSCIDSGTPEAHLQGPGRVLVLDKQPFLCAEAVPSWVGELQPQCHMPQSMLCTSVQGLFGSTFGSQDRSGSISGTLCISACSSFIGSNPATPCFLPPICLVQLQWHLQFDAFSLDLADFQVPAEVCSEEAEVAEVGAAAPWQ